MQRNYVKQFHLCHLLVRKQTISRYSATKLKFGLSKLLQNISDVKFIITDTKGRPLETAQLEIQTQPGLPPNVNQANQEGTVTLNQCYGDIINGITVSNAQFCPMTFDVTVDEVPRLTIPIELKGLTGVYSQCEHLENFCSLLFFQKLIIGQFSCGL